MREIYLLLISMLTIVVNINAKEIVKTDFGANLKPVNNKFKRISGELPEGWEDNSGYCDANVNYKSITFQNNVYLKMKLKKISNGVAQICYPGLPKVSDNTIFQLKIKLRNLSGGKVKIGLRQINAPYKFYWSVAEKFSPEWETYTFSFTMLKGNDKPMGIWICLYEPGELDIAELKLERITSKDLKNEFDKLKNRYPDNGPNNLIRNSRLPFGLQSGWSLYRSSQEDDVKLRSVSDKTSLYGFTVFQMRATDKPACLISEPFKVVMANMKHVFKLRGKGTGNFKFIIKYKDHVFGEEKVTLFPYKWYDIKIPFTPNLFTPCYQLIISGKGVLNVDEFRVCPKEKIDKEELSVRSEVALAIHESETSVSRIQFVDTPSIMRYCVTGLDKNSILKLKVTNLYGETKKINDIKLRPAKILYGEFDFGCFPQKQLGSFRVEAWIEQNGKRVSPFNELVVTRIRRPRYWGKDAPKSSFGVHMMPVRRSLVLAKAAGINWTRLHDAGLAYIGWWGLEPEKGKWRFYDREIKRYRKHNIMIFGELGTAPEWASYYSRIGRKTFTYLDKFFQPVNMNDYLNYVKVVTEHYKNDITAYDVWNEPWNHAWWRVEDSKVKPCKNPQKDYVNLMKNAYVGAKSTDNKIIIAGVNTTSVSISTKHNFNGYEWTSGVVGNGGLNYCDVISYHSYEKKVLGIPGDSVERGLKYALKPVFAKYGKAPKPVWMTEGSPVENTLNGLYKHTLPYESSDLYDETSNKLVRYMMSLKANGIQRHFLYSIHGHRGLFAENIEGCRILTNMDGYPHPSAVAHSNYAYLIEDTEFVKIAQIRNGVYAYIFSNADRTVACISTAKIHDKYQLPESSSIDMLDIYGNKLSNDIWAEEEIIYLVGKISSEEMLIILNGPA